MTSMETDDDAAILLTHPDSAENAHLGLTMVKHIKNRSARKVIVHGNLDQVDGDDALAIAPLLQLQRSIATCFEEAHASYKHMPEVASQVRRGATMCRSQLVESVKMLRKISQTATTVLEMFPDLELAVEEGEPTLAIEFFNMVKGWVVEVPLTPNLNT
jgi:hypothetical protein